MIFFTWTPDFTSFNYTNYFENVIVLEATEFFAIKELTLFLSPFLSFISTQLYINILSSWLYFFDSLLISTVLVDFFSLDSFVFIGILVTKLDFLFSSHQGCLILYFFLSSHESLFFISDWISSFSLFFTDTIRFYSSFYFYPNSILCTFYYYYLGFFFLFSILYTLYTLLPYRLILFMHNFFTLKYILFLNSFAFENRFQLDFALYFFVFVFFLWIPVLMTYDDLNEESVELFHNFLSLLFLYIISYLLYKYSVHYFSFLEGSVSDSYSVSFIVKQFVRDFSNTFALFLRFFLLLFRLNIYDGLDDFLDSYYIFFIDFDEDSYIDESLFYTYNLHFIIDNREDTVNYKVFEGFWWFDFFFLLFPFIWKIFFFLSIYSGGNFSSVFSILYFILNNFWSTRC